jgi:nucleotide-binding universal stress UspA family protein
MFHNILVAIDGSPDAEEALRQAIDLAESEHTRLTLISGPQELPVSGYLVAGEVLGGLIEDARAEAEAILRRACERVPADLSVTAVFADGPIRTALIRQIEQNRHDLVVMGSRGRGAVRAALLGSVSHYVLHHSPVPVLIVHVERSTEVRGRGRLAAPREPVRFRVEPGRAALHAVGRRPSR